jgi:hypothetical protein
MTRLSFAALALALTLGGCTFRGTGSVIVTAHATTAPSAPPQDRVENPGTKEGFVWIHGSWNHQNGKWTWIEGHWERERAGYRHNRGRWEARGSQWHWIEGDWVAVAGGNPTPGRPDVRDHRDEPDRDRPDVRDHRDDKRPDVRDHRDGTGHPTAAPPPLRVENHGPAKTGFVWIAGRWDWRNGAWAWIDGHWERERANQAWTPGRWELQGSFYVWIDGHWGASGDRTRDHRK